MSSRNRARFICWWPCGNRD